MANIARLICQKEDASTRERVYRDNRRHLAKPYHFNASGLPNVYLLNGVKIERDPDYGERIAIDHLPELIMGKRLRPRAQAALRACNEA